MPVIYVKEQGSVVRKRAGRILVEKDGQCLLEVPLRQTESLAVFGNVQVTTQALSELLERNIPVALYSRHGRLKGHVLPEASRNLELRLAQYRVALDPAASLAIARRLVQAKLLNQAIIVEEHLTNHPSPALHAAAGRIRRDAEAAAGSPSAEALLGNEGAGAAAFFEAFAEMNRSGLPFAGRERHPPPDPVNALLSLGYTMTLNETRSLAEGLGLEPYLGFLHRVDYGRPSLALDLMEPFRAPVADRLTLRLINQGILKAEDFARRLGEAGGGVVLMPEAFHRYLECYEAAMDEPRRAAPKGLREALREQVERMAAFLRHGQDFQPYVEGV